MAARTAAVAPKRRGRGGLRILIALVVIVLLVVAGIVTLGVVASADTTVGAVLTTFVPNASVAHSGGGFAAAASGTLVQPGDSVQTDATGRAQIQFPDGTITRLANNTEIKINSSHFAKSGHVHDISVTDKLGRTLNSVQKLVGGATFQVIGNTTTASVRGTLFEVLVNADGSVVIKLFIGGLDVDGKSGHVHLTEGQQVTVDPSGNIGQPGPIQPDPNDPFSQEVQAMQQVETQTTPGTEEDFTGGLLHNGQIQTFSYAFAAPPSGGSDLKAALAYPGSLMELRITDPANHVYTRTGPSPIVITIPDPPGGIFKFEIIGISGLDPDGEVPFLSVATLEPCETANIEQNGAVRHSYTAADLVSAVNISGLSDLKVNILGDTTGGAILTGSASYNGIGLAGTLLLYTHGGNIGVIPLAASAFGVSIPPQQAAQQIASALGQDPNNVSVGFHVERLFTCQNVLMIEGRSA
ncbi:MAG TPA: FecR family protein [Candidatus Dormibacteraeota bacterium]|nr:FecR family protein [Candidatus Dormibacteraeota bacterium]